MDLTIAPKTSLSINSTCKERIGEPYIHNSVTSTNTINSTYDDMVKASWSKCIGINGICCILNFVSKDEEYVKVFVAKKVSSENNSTVQVICKNNPPRASFVY